MAAPSYDLLRVRLIQVRERPAVVREEQTTFLERCALRPDQLVVTNALEDRIHPELLDGMDAVLIGGAGAYSVTHTYPWTSALVQLVQACYDRHVPLFGSCWGHQFVARALGGTVVKDLARSEMGTHPVELTEAAQADPLFCAFPSRFSAQMGHQDRVSALPAEAVELARNAVAPFQAFRIADRPIYGTQFHSELNVERMQQRILAYRAHYTDVLQNEAALDATLTALHETPEVDGLLAAFLQHFAIETP